MSFRLNANVDFFENIERYKPLDLQQSEFIHLCIFNAYPAWNIFKQFIWLNAKTSPSFIFNTQYFT